MSIVSDAAIAVPLLRFVGRELDPDRGVPFLFLDLAKRSLAVDPDERTLELTRRSLQTSPDGGIMFDGITAAIRQTHRVDPLARGPLDGLRPRPPRPPAPRARGALA